MKHTKKITLCGIIAALSTVVMLCGYFPYLTYAIPAIAGLFMIAPLIECGVYWSLGSFAVTAIITLFAGEVETKVLFITLFGYYPILKAVIERLKSRVAEWLLKLLVFNASAVASYFIMSLLFNISFSELALWGKYGAYILLALCNGIFVIYDVGISRVAAYYSYALHDKIKKILK